MANYYWYNVSGNPSQWGTSGANCRWYSGPGGTGTRYTAPPTAADNAIFDASSGTTACGFAANYTANCLSLLCNGIDGTSPTTTQITSASGVTINVNADISLSASQVFDVKLYPTVVMTGTSAATISTNGNSFGNLTINKSTGSVTLNDDLIGLGNAILTLTSGTFNGDGKNVTFGAFYTSGTATRTLNMGSGTWTMAFEGESTSLPINTWNIASSTGLTLSAGTSTIKMIHAANNPAATNDSLVIGLKNAFTSSSTTIDITDITGFPTSGTVLIGNEVVQYVGTNTTTKQLGTTSLTRGYGGTTIAASVPAGTAVTGVLFGNSTLAVGMTAGVAAPISVVNASLYPQSGTVYIGTEVIAYSGTNLTTNQLGTTSVDTPTQNHSIGDPVYSYQAKVFNGGGQTYYNLVFGCFGYKLKNYIYGSNTFNNIYNSNTGFTWTTNSDKYPGFQELAFEASTTNIISTSLSFTGTTAYQQQIDSQTAGTQTTLSIIPATAGWNVGTHSVDNGNNTNLSYTAGAVDYITWQDIFALPAPSTAHSYLGYSGVANQIQTTPGNALGVVGNANAGLGDDVGGNGVVDVYSGV